MKTLQVSTSDIHPGHFLTKQTFSGKYPLGFAKQPQPHHLHRIQTPQLNKV